MRLLVRHGADVNASAAESMYGASALYLAAQGGNPYPNPNPHPHPHPNPNPNPKPKPNPNPNPNPNRNQGTTRRAPR